MKKVCFITPPFFKYPTKSGGAVETLITILGEKNNKYNEIDLEVLSLKRGETGNISLNILDKILFSIYRVLKKILKTDFFYLNRYYYKVYKTILRNNFDLVIFEGGDVKKYKKLGKKLTNKIGKDKMVLHAHLVVDCEKEEEDTNIIMDIFGKFIGVSNFSVKGITSKYNIKEENVKILKNCTTEDFSSNISNSDKINLRNKLNIKEDDFVILFVGRLVEKKGIGQLITAIKNIKNSKIKLLILGSNFSAESAETDFTKKLKKMIQGCEDRIIFTGHVAHNEIYKYYQIANIQVIPSIWEESAGLVAIEGMTTGLPIIATISGGMVEYLDENCAEFVDKEKNLEKKLENAILNLYDDKEKCKKMSMAGKEKAKLYSSQKYYEDFVKIIKEWD